MSELPNTTEAIHPEVGSDFVCMELVSDEDRLSYRAALAEIEDVVFADDAFRAKAGVNFIRDMPDSMYYNPENILLVLEDPGTNEVEGFTFLEKRGDDTYYANITGVLHQGQGNVNKLIEKRDRVLRDKGIKYVLTHVDAAKGYAKKLGEKYSLAELRPGDEEFLQPHQVALRMEL